MFTSETEVQNGTSISIETGNWSKQAHGSVVYRSGNLLIHATVCAARDAREGQDFFPLTVEYREKIFSVGRFPGGYIKRENRPAEHEILLSRIIDRPIRPLFPEGYYSEVQLLVQVYSADESTSIQGHAITAASSALMASDIPFHGPIAGVLVGRVNGEFIANPTVEQMAESDLELIVAGSADAISMIEGGAGELTSEQVLDAISFAHEFIKTQLKMQTDLAESMKIEKREITQRLPDEAIQKEMVEFAKDKMEAASNASEKTARGDAVRKVYEETVEHFKGKLEGQDGAEQHIKDIKEGLHSLEADVIRSQIFDKGIRADGRQLDEIRDISVELDVLPGAHGSAVFTRGQTQSLGVVTLGTQGDNQRYETLAGQQAKNFFLHYNFPPYSVGEVRRFGFPGRREIGHGNLAERALKYMVPSQEKFPYVIRVVSEIMESNGSSSMASVCSGSMAMMAAGVPIEKAVSGIAMGLITDESGDYRVLSDIAGLEDHFGDMDFKITGTRDGITAFQLDIKVTGISLEIMKEALAQAEKARLHILDKMEAAIPDARGQVPDNAPRITTIKIDPDRIGELIGPGGKVIRGIIEKTGAEVNVEDDGSVTISSVNGKSNELAQKMVEDIFREVEVGEIYEGIVKKITDFGAFVELVPGKEGLVHISKLDVERVASVRDVVEEGDTVKVKVIGVDRMGRIDLSRKDLLPGGESSNGGDRDRGGRDGGGRGGDRERGGDRGGRSGGGDRGGRGGGRGGRGGDRERSGSGGGGRGGNRR